MAAPVDNTPYFKVPYRDPGAPEIPKSLPVDETRTYMRLLRHKRDAGQAGCHVPQVVVITDIAKDYDDLSAMILLKELHRLGFSKCP